MIAANDTLARLLLAELVRSWPDDFPMARAYLAPTKLAQAPATIRDRGSAESLCAELRAAGVATAKVTHDGHAVFQSSSSWFYVSETPEGSVYVCDAARTYHWLTPREFMFALKDLTLNKQ